MIAGTATTGKVLESVSACISTMPFLRSLLLCGFILLELSYAAVHLNTWAVHIEGGESVAKRIAEENGFIYNGHIFDDYHEFTHNHVAKRSTSSNTHHHNLLKNHPQVRWCEQQVVKRRVKRDLVRDQRDEGNFNDPKWPKMWYLRRSDAPNMNVVPAWRKGYTGKGVVVSILDDGIERDHPDLLDNYDPDASYDVNGHDNDPQPRYDYSNENRHGTRCAGEVAAVANNHICNIGIAFEASIGGVRMLDGDVTDSVEAKSLSYHPQHIHIYSASWGPDDDGRTVDGPATLARNAFYNGITKGRGGLGSIFVWASGNGGRDGDSCNCDGYTNSIYTLSISSATENGNIPWYSEACSSTLATTYSSGSGSEKQIVTTDLRKGCTETHTGTSASAPLAAGIVALALHSNPKMTWRDLQHIVVMTARPANLHAGDWVTNGVGRRVSHSFGYGLMDAAAMTDLARNWTVVPEQKICEIRSGDTNRIIPVNGKLQVRIESNGCDRTKNHVAYLEHVQAKVTITSSRRGDMQIYLISPQGTRSTLLARRVRDNSGEGFNDWAFMTTHSWGETSKGRWTLEVENLSSISELRHWSLVLYGTPTHPQRGASTNNQVSPHHPRTTPVFSGACHGVVLGNGSCVACGDLYYLKGFCYKKCTSNFYGTRKEFPQGNETEKHNVCLPCATYCRECDGPSLDDCKECIEGFDLKNQTCVRTFLYLGIFEKSTFVMSGLAVALCAVPVILFFLIFTFLQAREQGWFCFRDKMPVYVPVDADAAADKANDADVEFHKEKNGNAVVDIKIEKNGQHQALLDMESDEDEEIFSGPAPY